MGSEKIEEAKKKEESVEGKMNTFLSNQRTSWEEDALEDFAGKDEEVRKKALFYHSRFKDPGETKAEIRKNMEDAVRLAKAEVRPDGLKAAMPSFGAGKPAPTRPETLNADQTDLLKKLDPQAAKRILKNLNEKGK